MKTWLLLVGVPVLSTGSLSAIVAQEPEKPAATPSAEDPAKLALPGRNMRSWRSTRATGR